MANAPKARIANDSTVQSTTEEKVEKNAPRLEKNSSPAPRIETAAAEVASPTREDTLAEEAVNSDAQATTGASSIRAWLSTHIRGHEHMVIGALCGLLIVLLVFAVGLLRALFVVVMIGGGAAIGQTFDGDSRIIDFIKQVLSERRG